MVERETLDNRRNDCAFEFLSVAFQVASPEENLCAKLSIATLIAASRFERLVPLLCGRRAEEPTLEKHWNQSRDLHR